MSDLLNFFTAETLRRGDLSPDDIESIIYDMLATLPEGLFHKDISGTNVYKIFSVMAQQLLDLRLEINATKTDLLPLVSRSDIINNTESQAYNNHGLFFDYNKIFIQDWVDYNIDTALQGYLQGLKLMYDAALLGNTYQGMRRVGHAITSIAPLILENYKTPNWIASVESGSITGSGNIHNIIDNDKSWIPDEWVDQYLQVHNRFTPWGFIGGASGSWNNLGTYPENDILPDLVYNKGYLYGLGGEISGEYSPNIFRTTVDNNGDIAGWEIPPAIFLPEELKDFGVISVNNKLYVLGGKDISDNYSDAVNLLDADNNWVAQYSLPMPLASFAVVYYNNYIYTIGGATDSGVAVSIIYGAEVLSGGTLGDWNEVGNLPLPIKEITGQVSDNGIVYIFGGLSGAGTYRTEILYSDFSNVEYNVWTETTAAFDTGRSRIKSTRAGSFIYLAGHYDGTDYYGNCYRCMLPYNTEDITFIGQIPSIEIPSNPVGITSFGNFIYILSDDGGTVNLSELDSRYIVDVATFEAPKGVARTGNYIYVADTGNDQIDKLRHSDSDLSLIHYVGSYTGADALALSAPEDVDAYGLYIYVADTGNHRVMKLLSSSMTYFSAAGSYGTADDEFDTPKGIVFARFNNGNEFLYIADSGNNRIVVKDPVSLETLDVISTPSGSLSSPSKVWFKDDYLYIADTGNNRVLKLLCTGPASVTPEIEYTDTTAPEGGCSNDAFAFIPYSSGSIKRYSDDIYLNTLGSFGSGSLNLNNPAKIYSYDNLLYITDVGNDRIAIWRTSDDEPVLISSNNVDSVTIHENIASLGVVSGSDYTIGKSLIGTTGYMASDSMLYNGMEVHVWGPVVSGSYVSEVQDTFEGIAKLIKPAHVRPRYIYHEDYLIHAGQAALSSGSYPANLITISSGSLFPIRSTIVNTYSGSVGVPSGVYYISPVLDVGEDYNIYDWYVDYCWRISNQSSGSVEIQRADFADDFDDAVWEPVVYDDILVKEDMHRYLKYRIGIYASGSNEFEFRSFSLRGFPNIYEADFSYEADDDGINFTDLSTGSVNYWLWDFGDGEYSTEQNPSHTYTYSSDSYFKVTLRVSDGSSNFKYKVAYVYVTASQAKFHIDGATAEDSFDFGNIPFTVQFINDSVGDITAYDWDFGDGTGHATTRNTNHIYTAEGTFFTTLTITSGGIDKTYTMSIRVGPVLVAVPTADVTSGDIPLTVQFTNSSVGYTDSWSWDFGDGETSNEENPVHTFTVADTYNVALTVNFRDSVAPSTDYISITADAITLDYKKVITIDKTLVLDDLVDFPVLLNITFSAPEKAHLNSGGTNVRFQNALNESIPFELINYNSSTGVMTGVVKTELSASLNTTINCYYGGADQSNILEPPDGDLGSYNVWDDNYVLVMHGKNYGYIAMQDSTSNANNFIKSVYNNPEEVSGAIYKAQSFSGAFNLTKAAHNSSIDNLTDITISCFITHDNNNYHGVLDKSPDQFDVSIPDGIAFNGRDSEDNAIQFMTSLSFPTAVTKYVVIGYGAGPSTIIDIPSYPDSGAPGPSLDIVSTGNGELAPSSYTLYLGVLQGARYFQGDIEELRISNIVRDSTWYKTEFNNLVGLDTGTPPFYVVGAEEAGSLIITEVFI